MTERRDRLGHLAWGASGKRNAFVFAWCRQVFQFRPLALVDARVTRGVRRGCGAKLAPRANPRIGDHRPHALVYQTGATLATGKDRSTIIVRAQAGSTSAGNQHGGGHDDYHSQELSTHGEPRRRIDNPTSAPAQRNNRHNYCRTQALPNPQPFPEKCHEWREITASDRRNVSEVLPDRPVSSSSAGNS